jgi:hypothetical protein
MYKEGFQLHHLYSFKSRVSRVVLSSPATCHANQANRLLVAPTTSPPTALATTNQATRANRPPVVPATSELCDRCTTFESLDRRCRASSPSHRRRSQPPPRADVHATASASWCRVSSTVPSVVATLAPAPREMPAPSPETTPPARGAPTAIESPALYVMLPRPLF